MSGTPLEAAVRELRSTGDDRITDDGVAEVGRRIAEALRRAPRRSWWLQSGIPGTPRGDSVRVADRALISALRLALAELDDVEPLDLQVLAVEHRCTAVRVVLSVGYRADVRAVARRTAVVAVRVLDALLGPDGPEVAPRRVDVEVVDVHLPRTDGFHASVTTSD
jgi:hypothetical protein